MKVWTSPRRRAALSVFVVAILAVPLALTVRPTSVIPVRAVGAPAVVGSCPPGSQSSEPSILDAANPPTLVAGPNGTEIFTVSYVDEQAMDGSDASVSVNGGPAALFGSASNTITGNPGDLNPAYPDPTNHGAYTVNPSDSSDWSLAIAGATLEVKGTSVFNGHTKFDWTWGHEKDIVNSETGTNHAKIIYTFPAPAGTTVSVTVAMQDGDFCGDTASATINFTNPSPAALSVTKTADAATVNAGDNIGFTVKVQNTSSVGATAVTLNDSLPGAAGVTWAISPAYPGPGTCSVSTGSPQTLSCSFGNMAAGASASVHIASGTAQTASGTLTNMATASASNAPSASGTATITINPPAVGIQKTADAPSVSSGQPIGFTVAVTNTGTGTAENASISDSLPSGMGVVWSISPAYAGQGTCSVSSPPNQTLSCTLGNLAPGAGVSVHISSNTTASTTGTLTNTATVSGDNFPTKSSTDTTTVLQPSLSFSKQADSAQVSAGTPIGFTINISNAGPGTALGATIHDPLPGATGVSWSISPAYTGPGTCGISGSAPSQTLDCALGDLAPNAGASVHVSSSTTVAVGLLTNTATGGASNAPTQTSTATVNVIGPTLVVAKNADSPSVGAGMPIGYTIKVTNNGPGDATGITIDDTLPTNTGLSWSVAPAVAGCGIGGGALHCSLGPLTSGSSTSVHISSGTTSATCGTVMNQATAAALNATGSVHSLVTSITVQCPQLQITKTADMTPIVVGGQAGFQIVVKNVGTGTAQNVAVNDNLPSGTGLNWSISPAVQGCGVSSGSPQVLTCSGLTIGSGALVSIHVVSVTTSAQCGTMSNSASASASNATSVSTQTPATITVDCAALTVTKTSCPANTVPPGGYLTYSILVTNVGTSDAGVVTITDSVPAGTQFVSAPGGTFSGGTVTWSASIDVGKSVTESLTVLVTAADGGTVSNTASATSPQAAATANGTTQIHVSVGGANTHGNAYSLDASLLGLELFDHLGNVMTAEPGGPASAANLPLAINIPGVAALSVLSNTSNSSITDESTSTATSTVAGVSLLGGAITASTLHAVSQSTAGPLAATQGQNGTTFQNLVVAGQQVANVQPNTHVTIYTQILFIKVPLADVVLDEVNGTSSVAGTGGMSTANNSVNLVHITLRLAIGSLGIGTQIIIGHAATDAAFPSGFACGVQPGAVSGKAYIAGVHVGVGAGLIVNAQQGNAVLPPTGGSASDTVATVLLPNALTATAATDTTSGSLTPNPNSTARATVTAANVLGGLVTADLLDVSSSSGANGTSAATTFTTTIANLKVAGLAVAVSAAPNSTVVVSLPLGLTLSVVINEETVSGDGHSNTSGTINALDVQLFNSDGSLRVQVIVASAHSDAHTQ